MEEKSTIKPFRRYPLKKIFYTTQEKIRVKKSVNEYLRKNLQNKEPLRRNSLKDLWEIIGETNFWEKTRETAFEKKQEQTFKTLFELEIH